MSGKDESCLKESLIGTVLAKGGTVLKPGMFGDVVVERRRKPHTGDTCDIGLHIVPPFARTVLLFE
jgi:hypothetical protein